MIDLLMRLIGWLVPTGSQHWAQAMQAEVAAIPDPRAARRFALGCLWAAVILRFRAMTAVHVPWRAAGVAPARLMFIELNCACAAATVGVFYLVAARAPLSLIVVNTVAVLLGVLLFGASLFLRGLTPRIASVTTLAIAAVLLFTALRGADVDGASRWLQLGPLAIQTSLVCLPVAVVLFAHTANRWTTGAMIACAVAMAAQPDRAMAAALCAGLVALLLMQRTPAVAIASVAAAVAVLVTWLQADRLPAVPYVDHILWSSFRLHPMLGVALWVGSALLFVPMLIVPAGRARRACLACGACWAAIVLSAAVGAYPTPVVGYGGAAILGYFLCLAALGAQTAEPSALAHPATRAAGGPEAESGESLARVHDGAFVTAHASTARRAARVASPLCTHARVMSAGAFRPAFRAVLACVLSFALASGRAGAQRSADDCARTAVPKVEGPGVWQPGPTGQQVPLWPDDRDVQPPETGGRPEYVGNGSPLVAGRKWNWATYVARPTMTIYQPTSARTGAAMVVLPGGGYAAVAMDLEGTEICDWITAQGVTCVLLKYRVPSIWPRDGRGVSHPPAVQLPLQDAQRAIGLLRSRAAEYGVDPQKIGVVGFSAGGHLAAAVSNAERRTYAVTDAADLVSSIPNYAILVYPGRLWDSESRKAGLHVAPWVTITSNAPPTLLIHAMNDPVDDVRHSTTYGLSLHDAGVPVDMRFYARGCHAFGLRATADPITTEWPSDAVRWLRQLGMLVPARQP